MTRRAPSRLLVPGLVAGLLLPACGEPARTRPEAGDEAGWTATAPGPLTARHSTLAVTVADEVLLLGGSHSSLCPPTADCSEPAVPLADGAAYRPADDRWRRLATAPLAMQLGDETAVLDGRIYVLTRPDSPTGASRFVSYTVADDHWQTLTAPPAGQRRLVATSRAVVAYASSDEGGTLADQAYDPVTATWTPLPDDPLGSSFGRTMVWAGDRLVLLAPRLVPQPGGADGPSYLRAATYDPGAGAWIALPDTRQVISGELSPVWDGARLLNPSPGGADGGETNGYGRTIPYGGWLDIRTGQWEALPATPFDRYAGWGVGAASPAYAAVGSIVLDVAARRWVRLRPPPDPVGQGSTAAWVGDRIVVWGGGSLDAQARSTLLATGAVWRAPR